MTTKEEKNAKRAKYVREHRRKVAELKKKEEARRERMKKVGGPKSAYSELLADTICSRIANGESLHKICSDDGYPTAGTVMNWVSNPDPTARFGFVEKFLMAKEIGYHLMADQIIAISDDSAGDKYIKTLPNGEEVEVINHETVQRDRLRVDSRKFILSKALPKIYGDRIQVETTINVNLQDRIGRARERIARLSDQMVIEGIIEGSVEE